MPYRAFLTASLTGALLATACATSSGDANDDDDDDGTSTSSSNSSSSTGGAMNTGGASGTGGDGGGSATDDSLHPLAVGMVWTYNVSPVGNGAICNPGAHDAEIVGTSMIDGRETFEMTNWCTGVSDTQQLARGDGEELLLRYTDQWLRVIAEPIEQGAMWDYFNTSYTWESAGSVTMPAGTFNDCWTARQNVSYTAYQTYCPGVGMVESYSEDLAGNGWTAQLASY